MTCRDEAKEMLSSLFLFVKLAFLLNWTFKIPPCLFSRAINFELMVSSFSASQIGHFEYTVIIKYSQITVWQSLM